jgi:hypothetical protein
MGQRGASNIHKAGNETDYYGMDEWSETRINVVAVAGVDRHRTRATALWAHRPARSRRLVAWILGRNVFGPVRGPWTGLAIRVVRRVRSYVRE